MSLDASMQEWQTTVVEYASGLSPRSTTTCQSSVSTSVFGILGQTRWIRFHLQTNHSGEGQGDAVRAELHRALHEKSETAGCCFHGVSARKQYARFSGLVNLRTRNKSCSFTKSRVCLHTSGVKGMISWYWFGIWQRPFGNFPKIHPFWWGVASLSSPENLVMLQSLQCKRYFSSAFCNFLQFGTKECIFAFETNQCLQFGTNTFLQFWTNTFVQFWD